MDVDIGKLAPEMITMQNNAETHPVIAYRTILYTVRRMKGSDKRLGGQT
jgi:hypothetical protein